MSEFKSWGERYSPSLYHAMDLACECGHWGFDFIMKIDQVVGFSLDGPPSSSGLDIGIVIVECPLCFSKFWFHVREILADKMRHFCSKWPKD